MTVIVNNKAVTVAPGMTVRHALIAAGYGLPKGREKVRDEWGNEVGLDGALAEGMKLTLTGTFPAR
jgi:hypothetical protein